MGLVKRSVRPVLWWGLVLIWCAVIFIGTGDRHFTGRSTEAAVAKVVLAIGLGSGRAVEWANVALRKSTHVLLFGTLGCLAWQAIRVWPGAGSGAGSGVGSGAGRAPAGVWAWGLTTLYAASDEWHQVFLPGRTASVQDVLLDSAGAAVVLFIVSYVIKRIKVRRRQPATRESL